MPLTLRHGLFAAAAALIIATAAAHAHHGWGSYDAARKMTIAAPIASVNWHNPHVLLTLAHEGHAWEVVLAPVSRMVNRGLSEAMLATGTEVSVEGYPSTAHQHELRAERITVAGKTVELR